MQEKTFEQYALLDAKIKDLKNQQDAMRVEVLEEMVKNGESKIESTVGSFSVSNRKTWSYTPAVKEANEKLKALKAKEESTGDATYKEVPSLRFTPIKL